MCLMRSGIVPISAQSLSLWRALSGGFLEKSKSDDTLGQSFLCMGGVEGRRADGVYQLIQGWAVVPTKHYLKG